MTVMPNVGLDKSVVNGTDNKSSPGNNQACQPQKP